ncbi:hypothetical protein LUZ60_001900 [Juncus effusus]|nr:hypothetical protein LUZ60_001900 [Juncus effusus]
MNQTLEDMLRACILEMGGSWEQHLPLVEFSYSNSYQASIGISLFEALYGSRCRTPLCWEPVGKRVPTMPELIEESVEQVERKARFGLCGKLNPRYIGPFDILKREGEVAYRLALPPSLAGVHDTFRVSLLRKYIHDPSHVIEYEPLRFERGLSYLEEPVHIVDRKEQQLRRRIIPYVKVQWRNHTEREATWELESEMREKYSDLFIEEGIFYRLRTKDSV